METLDDFRYWFAAESEVEGFLATSKDIENQDLKLQASRLRSAWLQVNAHMETREELLADINCADLDTIIEGSQLSQASQVMIKASFRTRYEVRYPPDYRLAEALIEKCYREIHKRRRLSINGHNRDRADPQGEASDAKLGRPQDKATTGYVEDIRRPYVNWTPKWHT